MFVHIRVSVFEYRHSIHSAFDKINMCCVDSECLQAGVTCKFCLKDEKWRVVTGIHNLHGRSSAIVYVGSEFECGSSSPVATSSKL